MDKKEIYGFRKPLEAAVGLYRMQSGIMWAQMWRQSVMSVALFEVCTSVA